MIDYAKLREIERRELSENGLVKLEDNFYDEVREYLELLEKKISAKDLLALREYENAKKIVERIKEKREEKILLFALRDVEVEGLTKEERELYAKVKRAIAEYRKALEEKENIKKERVKKVKILTKIEPYKGADGNIYGPYEEGDIVEINEEEANFLVEEGLAEVVE